MKGTFIASDATKAPFITADQAYMASQIAMKCARVRADLAKIALYRI